jgi:hypothetical protein
MRNKSGLLVAAMTTALVSHAWASTPVTQADALADIARVNAADGQKLRQIIRNVNAEYGTQQRFTSGAITAAQATGDAAAQAAGIQYDTATQQSLDGAAKHRQGNESKAVAPAAQASANSMSGPIARHEEQGQQYEQDASNAENYVCTSTNKKGQCTGGYWNCNGTCQYYRGLARHQFHLASIDQSQQSDMAAQASRLQQQGSQQLRQHAILDGEAKSNESGAYSTNVDGAQQAGTLEQEGQAQIVQQARTGMDEELARMRASIGVSGEDVPYQLPSIPVQSARALTAPVRTEVDQLQAKATQLADTAMQESKAAAEAYRQYRGYLQAESQAKEQAAQDEANAAAAPTPSSRAAWAAAAAAMQSKARDDAQKAKEQHAIYQKDKQAAKKHTQMSEQIAQKEVQVANGATEQKARQQIQPYLQ